MAAGRIGSVRRADRLVALLALAGFLAGSLGVPVLVPPDASDFQAYPCRGHRCGCTSAQQCWFSCCCLTHQEKLEWARQHGVQPPEGVVLLARKEAELARKAAQRKGGCACCRPAAEPSLCATAPGGECCGQPQDSKPAASRSGASRWSLGWVCAVSARRCQGQAQQWMALGSVAPPPDPYHVKGDLDVSPFFALPIASLCGVSFAPQPPPPRA